jgi:elongator complex protein 3
MEETLDAFMPLFKKALESGSIKNSSTLLSEKRKICEKLHMYNIPKNGEILAILGRSYRRKFYSVLKSKPIRTLSGVTVVALMTKPYDCPHGVCIFCPGGTKTNTPQSYTGFEPAARRAKMNDYDPYLQVQARLKHYVFMGYVPQKIEIIAMGGTFTTLPKEYRDEYVMQIYRALNDFPDFNSSVVTNLETQKRTNETADTRCVAFAIETKPERCGEKEIKELLDYGVTRVEMGVQSVYDDILKKNNRGHDITDVKEATKILRDNAYKVDYHAMLNLPFSDMDKDRETIKQIYSDESFKPDAIKIYPTLVIKGTALYNMWKEGKYKPYPLEDIIKIIIEAEATAPHWLRIMRVERDIPSNLIEEGVKVTNLRQLVSERMASAGIKAKDIRNREVGHVILSKKPEIRSKRENYRAADGDEVFLSVEDVANDAIIGFLRLRVADGSNESLVRELHVYGEQKTIESSDDTGFQHKGFGRELLKEAEQITRNEYSLRHIKIISGVGVRDYYRKEGYKLERDYMVKEL